MRLTGVSSAGVAAICVFVCLGNGLTLLAIGRTRSLRNKCNLLIAHLALVDLVTGLVTWPVLKYLAEDGGSLLSCLGAHGIVIALKDTSQFLLLFICVVMYIKIAYPLRYRRWLCTWKMHAVTAATWVLGATIGTLSFVWARYDADVIKVERCFITIMPFPYWVGVVNWLFVAVSVAILVMYVRIIRIASRHLHHHDSQRRTPPVSGRRLTAGGGPTSRVPSFARPSVIATHDTPPLPPAPSQFPAAVATVIGEAQKQDGGETGTGGMTDSGGCDGDRAYMNVHQSDSSESDRNRNYCEFNRNELNKIFLIHAELSYKESKSDGHIDSLYRCEDAAMQMMETSLQGTLPNPRLTEVKVTVKSSSLNCVRARSSPLERSRSISRSRRVPCTMPGQAASQDESFATLAAPEPSRCSVAVLDAAGGVRGISGVVSGIPARKKQHTHNHELQLTITMLVTYLAFIVCWLPLEVAVYCTSLGLITNASQSPFVEFSLALSLANSGVNVVIYSWRYLAFRKAIRNLFTCRSRQATRLTCNYASSTYA